MDIVILIIVLGLILFIIFGNQTKKNYKKGVNALCLGDLDLAEQFFRKISDKYPPAKTKLDTVTFKRGEIAEKAGNLNLAYDLFLSIQERYPDAVIKLIDIDFSRGISAKNKGDLDLAYSYFSKIADKNKNAFYEASKIDFKRGIDAETNRNYTLAKSHYQRSLSYKDDIKMHYGSLCRTYLCDIKKNELPSEKDIAIVAKSAFDTQMINDLLYRYTLTHLKRGNYNFASDIIKNYADNSLPEFNNLGNVIVNVKKTSLRRILEEINDSLTNTRIDSSFLENINKKIETNKDIINDFPDYSQDIHEFQKNIFSKLIIQYLNENQFEKCLDFIISYPNFYNNTELLKNAGICCIRIALENQLNEKNYKKIIPIWLTAVYNDDIFINSIEYTTWDDDYTFSVKGAIGKYGSFIYERDWSNINNEAQSETNISIGNSQRDLMNIFEKSLNCVQPENLQNKVFSFYAEEKNAISDLVETLGYDILHSTPEFAKRFNFGSNILDLAERRYQKDKKERLLKTGAQYVDLVLENGGVKLQTDYIFEKYASSMYYQNTALNHLKNKNVDLLEEKVFKKVIERFASVKSEFEEKSLSIIREFISKNEEDKSLIPLMEALLRIIPDSDKLRFLFADFTTNYCILQYNSNPFTAVTSLDLLIKAIEICPTNHRTGKNLAIFISMNLSDNTFSWSINRQMSSLERAKSENLYEIFQSELIPQKRKLNSYLGKPNIDFFKVKQRMELIDKLIDCVKPTSF